MLLKRNILPQGLAPLLLAGLALSGCSFFPKGGPGGDDVKGYAWTIARCGSAPKPGFGADPRLAGAPVAAQQAYVLIKLDATNIPCFKPVLETGTSPGTKVAIAPIAPDLRLGVGDVVSVSIFEERPGGLFTPGEASGARPGNFVEIPAQAVARDGTIAVPYAGQLMVKGLTIPEVQKVIEQRLANKAIGPQVIVSTRTQFATLASVLGAVNEPAQLPLNLGGERVLDIIARAGGLKFPGYESVVTIQRGATRTKIDFLKLINNPANNGFVRPGDVVFVEREERLFVVLGASGQNGQYSFEAENINLSQALGKAEGLLDTQANPKAVFVYRLETRHALERHGVDTSVFAGDTIPTIYSIDFLDPSGFFIGSRFPIHHKDVIYIANAPAVELAKFLDLVLLSSTTIKAIEVIGKNN